MPRDSSGSARPSRVLVTGANGLIGQVIRHHLQPEFALRLLTRQRTPFSSHVADISDLAAIRPAFSGIDAVIHLAANAAVTAGWDEVLGANIVGTYNVFEAARDAGVGRVVFASSNHVVGMYEVDAAADPCRDRPPILDASVAVRPDSLYGVSKVFGEAIGRMYADRFGMRVVCLRIGTVLAGDDPSQAGSSSRPSPGRSAPGVTRERLAATWLSHRDLAQLVRCALVADVHWAVVYGVSDNPRRFWDIGEARAALGYLPQDSAPR